MHLNHYNQAPFIKPYKVIKRHNPIQITIKKVLEKMHNQEPYRRKTRSQLVDEQKQASRPQIPSQNNLQVPHVHSDIESSKPKQPKQLPTRKSNWNKKQKVKYLVFLNYYSELPYWGSDLKSIPTYKSLSQFVKSRSPEQCKSFHLSTRRSYKSIDQEIKALQEELQMEDGYQKMSDKYELEIIGFEEEHQILKMYDLKEKDYFHHKFEQTCKETGYKKKENNGSGELSQEQQPDYNSKINIKDLIMDKDVKEQKREEKTGNLDNYPPLINMQEFRRPQENYLKGSIPPGQKIPNMMMPNPQHPPLGMYRPENLFDPTQNNKSIDKIHMENMRMQGANTQGPSYGARPMPNQRMMPQGMGRMMEPNRNMYGQYPNYGPYASSPFSDINSMHLAQFRNQMPYSMPPPGGIPYMMQGYHDPYSMGNLPSRYGSKIDEQGEKSKNRNQPESIQSLSPEKARIPKNDINLQGPFSERRKQLLLNCHQHFVNWLRCVTQIDKRKQMGRNLVSQ